MRNRAQIICIGDELLIGQVINTNSAWLGSKLTELGFNVIKNIAISDNYDEIYTTIKQVSQEAELIIVTGGLGPTNDDITKNVLCNLFHSKLIRDIKTEEYIQKMFLSRNLPVTELNLQQADVPNNCEVLFNELGTAPGMLFKSKKSIVVSLPGVPFEMKNIFEKQLAEYLKRHFNLHEY
ncbi:MAG: damage-inducible protein CinA, partial [Bacteroidetes bacterium CG02_land_8_20_14_3_00_31_25]